MLQAFLAAQQNVAQEQQSMMREFLREQARARTDDNDRRASQAPVAPDMSDSDDVDDDGGEYRVKETGRLIAKHIKPDTFNGDMTKWDDWSFKLKRSINTILWCVKAGHNCFPLMFCSQSMKISEVMGLLQWVCICLLSLRIEILRTGTVWGGS